MTTDAGPTSVTGTTLTKTPTSTAVIIGGGLAGLATAVGLARHGVRCTLLESRPRLGGRASSFHDVASNQWIDNCQHVTMGCCTNFRDFCERTGLADSFRREDTLHFVAPDGRINPFRNSSLPAPLHLAAAFAGLSYFSWREKLALGLGIRRLARWPVTAPPQDMARWLDEARQPSRVIEMFWKVVLVSALSESLDRIGVTQARKVLVDGFLTHRDAWRVDIPTRPLEELYGTTLTDWLSQNHVDVQLQTAAERLIVEDARVQEVLLRNGERLTADHYILAVAPQRARALLPEILLAETAAIEQLEFAPISSLHLWFDRPITPLPHAVFVQGLTQWLFNRTALADRPHGLAPQKQTEPEKWYYQVVISASRDVQQSDSATIRERVLTELAAVFPETSRAQLLSFRQVTEHRAVFSPLPDSDRNRPPQQTSIGNLQLAGDYTQTGWPATMEGAVRSGYLAAENILRKQGILSRLLQPDLPVSRLSRWLYGL